MWRETSGVGDRKSSLTAFRFNSLQGFGELSVSIHLFVLNLFLLSLKPQTSKTQTQPPLKAM